jgi:ribosomal silencing factor RsfS
LLEALAAFVGDLRQMARLEAGTQTEQSFPCNNGGQAVLRGKVTNDQRFSAGDAFDLDLSGCGMLLTGLLLPATVDGRITVAIASGESSWADNFNLAMAVSTADLTARATETVTTRGAMQLQWKSVSRNEWSVLGTGSSLVHTASSSTRTRTSTWKKYRLELVAANSDVRASLAAEVESLNPRLGTAAVSYRLSTVRAFRVNAGGDVPSGALKVASGPSVLTFANGIRGYVADLDADGNGTADVSTEEIPSFVFRP